MFELELIVEEVLHCGNITFEIPLTIKNEDFNLKMNKIEWRMYLYINNIPYKKKITIS